jgi:uncharacterized membrane protein YfcA
MPRPWVGASAPADPAPVALGRPAPPLSPVPDAHARVGVLGGGGSILAVPALVYAAGQSLPQAVATSLLIVGITAVVALLPRLRAGQIAWRIAIFFGLAGATAAFAGAAVNRLLPDDVVLALFAALMVAAGVRMLQDEPNTAPARGRRSRQ